jgi:hypothetical protein
MTLKNGVVGIAGALGFSAIGLSGVANAATTPQATPGVVQQAQLAGWHGPGGPGGWHGPGWGGPGRGGPPPLCPFGICIERAVNHDGRLAGLSGKGVIESASSWAAGWEHRRRVAHR